MEKRIIGIFLTIPIFIFLFSTSFVIYADNQPSRIMQDEDELPRPVRARVIEVTSTDTKETPYSGGLFEVKSQIVKVKILKGEFRGEIIEAQHFLNSFNEAYSITLNKGQDVFLYIESGYDGSIENAYVSEIVRDKYILYLVIIFVILMLIVGKLKGLKSLISLGIMCLLVGYVFLPLILKGFNPVVISVPICISAIIITLLLVSGYNKKTLSAIIGTVGGVITAGIIALVMGHISSLTGLGDEESQMLLYIPQEITFDFRGLLFSGILIGAMGAVMDVGISIASSVNEVLAATPEIKTKNLIRSGINVGRDILGTMSNTLILAYASASIPIMLLHMAYNVSFSEFINRELIANEIVRALASSIGLVVTVPLTAVVAGTLLKGENVK
ncbi:UNVERIFIED_CONTAM: putative membrane protein [Acetivibrio alkalicellulosi]